MSTVSPKPLIMYAEDDYDDFESVKEALEQLTAKYTLHHARNGSEAVDYLEHTNGTLPCLIVLDLNMPIMDGKEVLEWIKDRQQFKTIPVMVFTTSSREEDVKLCQKHNCTFFRKPTLYRDLLHVVQTMLQMCEKNRSSNPQLS
jgi:CheY-like chemotaxis protein